jgi:putative ABC transport system substrate-binding protein
VNKRRKLVLALGAGAFGIPPMTGAQTQKIHRVGILITSSKSSPNLHAFVQELRRVGYMEGQNISFVIRFAEGDLERLPVFASELLAQKVDVVFTASSPGVQAVRRATTSIPIVFAVVSDPVGSGFVASLARPGGNITGTSNISRELSGKRLQILKEMVPKASRVAVLAADEPQIARMLEEVQQAAKLLGMSILTTQVQSRSDFETVHKQLRTWRADTIDVLDSSKNLFNSKLLAELAAYVRLPAIYPQSQYADAGGLISYGPNYEDLYRRAAQYVDKILKGAKPADLPVEEPTKFEMTVNLKTAKALRLKIPQLILGRADRLIE